MARLRLAPKEEGAMSENDDGYLRDSEVALMDTLKTVFEIIVAKKVTTPDAIGKMLQAQIDQYPKETMPRAVYVLEQLCNSVTDPTRKQFRALAEGRTEGSA